ncbi:MAG: hypothetical protein LBB53_02430, partial [Prevotellaceae bacterium]|nr:hypothetical protein [Prevotellaceae bacterium]
QTVNLYLKNSHSFPKNKNILDGIAYHSNFITIENFTINGLQQSAVQLDKKTNQLILKIIGSAVDKIKIDTEVRFYDENDILLATYAPAYSKNIIKNYEKGKFTIEETINLPQNLTKGNFYMNVILAIPKVDILATFPPITVHSDGYISPNGDDFEYRWNGLIIL